MPPRFRIALSVLAAVVVLVAVAVLIVVALRPGAAEHSGAGQEQSPSFDYALPTDAPPRSVGAASARVALLADREWVARVSAASGIPERALAAYAGVAIRKAEIMPGCALSWTTLAAIGLVESDHGRHGGSSVGVDGTVTPPIFGIALDGSSSAHIPDSDGGAIDGDATIDRAVGPMQLIPQAWRNWHVDGSGDGVEDPQNIDDAVFATANYLCRASGDMVSRTGWRAGVGSYNSSDVYVQSVASAANRYAEDAADSSTK